MANQQGKELPLLCAEIFWKDSNTPREFSRPENLLLLPDVWINLMPADMLLPVVCFDQCRAH